MNILPLFHFKNNYEAETALKIAKHYPLVVNEDLQYCLMREFGLEILFLKENNLPFLVVSENTIFDTNVDINDLSTFEIFPRCHNDTIYFDGQQVDVDDSTIVKEWYKHILPEFLVRNVQWFTPDEFSSLFVTKNLDLPFFIKSKEKLTTYFSLRHVINNYKDLPLKFENNTLIFNDKAPDYYCEYRECMVSSFSVSQPINCEIIVSDVMNIIADSHGKQEYRCYVINNSFVNASRYLDYEHTDIPDSIKLFANSFVETHKNIFPKHYVLDLAVTDVGIQIIELNPIPQSGRYVDNNVEMIYHTLLANNSYICKESHLRNILDKDKEIEVSLFLT